MCRLELSPSIYRSSRKQHVYCSRMFHNPHPIIGISHSVIHCPQLTEKNIVRSHRVDGGIVKTYSTNSASWQSPQALTRLYRTELHTQRFAWIPSGPIYSSPISRELMAYTGIFITINNRILFDETWVHTPIITYATKFCSDLAW